jgi:hypothetical protein
MKYTSIRIKLLEEKDEKYSIYHEVQGGGVGNKVVHGKFEVITLLVKYLEKQ